MTDREQVLGDVTLDLRIEREEAQGVGHGGAGLAHPLGHLLLLEIEIPDETRIAVGLLDRVEPFPLQILDQADGGRRGIAGLDEARRMVLILSIWKARQRRSPATSWNLSPCLRTTTGCNNPSLRMLSASSVS